MMTLSGREQELLRHLLKGDTEAAIARRLKLSVHTVHAHTKTIYRKLGVRSRAKLILKYL
jgi:DNA-binding NarL/FixJ family response regulator